MDHEALASAVEALASAEKSLVKLEKGCCDPKRTPCIADLDTTLEETAQILERFDGDPKTADAVVVHLSDIGAQLGKLQVTCCTPKRMPLYVRLLEDLTKVQLGVAAAAGQGHH